MDTSNLEGLLEGATKELISVLDQKINDLREASITDLVKVRLNSFEQFPEDVRKAAIDAYVMGLRNTQAPSDDQSATIQKERMELLAKNVVAGFSALIS